MLLLIGELDCLSDAELERIMDTSFNIVPTEEKKKQKVCRHLVLFLNIDVSVSGLQEVEKKIEGSNSFGEI